MNQLVSSLLGKEHLEDVSVDELRQLSHEFPYSPLVHFLYSRRLKVSNDPRFGESVAKTALYFNNPHWLHQQLMKRSDSERIAEMERALDEAQVHGADRQPEAAESAAFAQLLEEGQPSGETMLEESPAPADVQDGPDADGEPSTKSMRQEDAGYADGTIEEALRAEEWDTLLTEVDMGDTEDLTSSDPGAEETPLHEETQNTEATFATEEHEEIGVLGETDPAMTEVVTLQEEVQEPEMAVPETEEAGASVDVSTDVHTQETSPTDLTTDMTASPVSITEETPQTEEPQETDSEDDFATITHEEEPLDERGPETTETVMTTDMTAAPVSITEETPQTEEPQETDSEDDFATITHEEEPSDERRPVTAETVMTTDMTAAPVAVTEVTTQTEDPQETDSEDDFGTILHEDGASSEEAPAISESFTESLRALAEGLQQPLTSEPGQADAPIFEPASKTDYFASLGIRAEDDNREVFGIRQRSFTGWMRTMRPVDPERSRPVSFEDTEETIKMNAEQSNERHEVVTEAMAEVYEKQGLHRKAIDLYEKLSLLYPAKSAIFAAKILELKGK